VTLAPHDYFAHWLLGIGYYGSRQYEKARVEAVAAIKASKGAASDAEYLLGQALAGLGRNGEAIATLQKFVNEKPAGYYAPAAKTLIAKLQDAPAEAASQTRVVAGGQVAQNDVSTPAAH
jgi:tetratricopeptide (TPR) repeat protein